MNILLMNMDLLTILVTGDKRDVYNTNLRSFAYMCNYKYHSTVIAEFWKVISISLRINHRFMRWKIALKKTFYNDNS